jgi:hypothetical protein
MVFRMCSYRNSSRQGTMGDIRTKKNVFQNRGESAVVTLLRTREASGSILAVEAGYIYRESGCFPHSHKTFLEHCHIILRNQVRCFKFLVKFAN